MSVGLRTSLCLRASRTVGDWHGDPERAAAHLMAVDLAGDSVSLRMLRAAGTFALKDERPDAALRYLRRALAEPMPGPARAGLLAEIGAIEIGLGAASSGSTLRQALVLATGSSLRMRIATDLAHADAATGRPLGSAVDVIDEMCACLPSGRLAAEAEFGVFMACAQCADAGELFSQRLPRLRELAADDPHLATLAGLAGAWFDTCQGRDRAASVRRVLSALGAIDSQEAWELRLRWPALSILVEAEEYDLVQAGGRFAHRLGPAGDAMLSACLRGRLAHGRGELETARAELETALGSFPAAVTTAHMPLAQVLIELGELDAAGRLVSSHAPAAPASRTWAEAARAFARASLAMARGQLQEALTGFVEAGQALAALGIENPAILPWRSRAARCHARLGDQAAAARLAAEEVQLARAWGAPRALSTALAALGVVSLDADSAHEAVAVLGGIQAQSQRAAALVDLGAVCCETGAVGPARGHLQAGYALALTIGARPTWQRAARYLKHAGSRPDRRNSGVNALTAQERAAAERAATGATNRHIADEMVLTQRTVEQYLTSAYRKLGIARRSQLATALSHSPSTH